MDTNLDAFIEFDQKPQPDKQIGIRPPKASEGQIQPPAEIKNHITDFQKTRKTSW